MSQETIVTRFFSQMQQIARKPFLHLLDGEGRQVMGRYGALGQGAMQWSAFLQTLNLHVGERIIIILPHSLDQWLTYLGAVLGGFVPTYFSFPSPKLSKEAYFETVQALIASADARLIITYQELAEDLRAVCKLPIITAQDRPNTPPSQLAVPRVDQDAPAFIQYSSGTTGLKKGVAITHRMLLQQVDEYAQSIDLREDDVIASWLPLYHDMGLITCYWLPILTGTPIVVLSPFDWVRRPGTLLEAVQTHNATLCWLPNFAYQHIVSSVEEAAYDLSSLRRIVNCSEPLTEESHGLFLDKFQSCGLSQDSLWASYAMAENTFAVTSGPAIYDRIDTKEFSESGKALPASTGRTLLSSGRALPSTEITICDEERRVLPDRHVGEIYLRSPYLMQGYFNGEQPLSKGGYFATGDLGYLSEKQLFVTGRKKDLIIIAGKNIYPQDIEGLVNKVPGVVPGRCVAIGVDALGTQNLLVLAETQETSPEERARIRWEISERIARELEVVASDVGIVDHRWLCKSSSGKICRKQNLERYRGLSKKHQSEQLATPLLQKLQDLLHKTLDLRGKMGGDLKADQALIQSGILDSLSLVTLMIELENAFQIRIPESIQSNPSRFDTLEAIAHWLGELQTKRGETPNRSGLRNRLSSVRDRKCTDFLASKRNFDLIILGSSRVDSLNTHRLDQYGYKAFNFTVNTAFAEDWYCILRFILEHQNTPVRRILLGVDIESFNGYHSPDKRLIDCPYLRQYLESDAAQALEELYPVDRGLNSTMQSYHGEQRTRFQEVLLNLRSQSITQTRDVDYDPETGDIRFLRAGPVRHAYEAREALNFSYEKSGSFQMQTEMRLAEFHRLEERRVRYFTHIADLCGEHKTQLDCFLTPMHPIAKQSLIQKTLYDERVQDFLHLANRLNAPHLNVLDCSDPKTFGGLSPDFRDEMHMGPKNADKLVDYLCQR